MYRLGVYLKGESMAELFILEKISLDKELKDKVLICAQEKAQKVQRLAQEIYKGDTRHFRYCDDVERLAAVLKAAEKTYEMYKQKGIAESVFESTFDDVRIWCENNGGKGLGNYGWLKNHICFELFKLGRLQFQMFTAGKAVAALPNVPFKSGDKLLYVHIPQGEKLDFESCVSSFKEAKKFFGKYFPEFEYKYLFCESWLLYEGNRDFMKSESNIIRFADMFNIHCNLPLQSQHFERIFGVSKPVMLKSKAIKKLPENTSLQKAAKAYVLNRGKFGVGVGTVKEEFAVMDSR